MEAHQSQRVQELFHEALERPAVDRAAFLEQACEGDSLLRREVESLLASHGGAGRFLADPTVDVSGLAMPSVEPDDADGVKEAFTPGLRIGAYRLLEEIGEGGFAIVYLADQEEPVRRRVALKVVKAGMDTREVIARFEAERQALALMEHPNIAKVFDAGATASGRPFFVMELVRGVPITEYCDLNQLGARERLELLVTVCEAVQHAHQKGVIHRDLKPSNILVTLHDGKPVPKVIDFGIAKATKVRLTDRTVFTRFCQLLGTPAYMSPEQAEMSGLDVDTRSDVYSLGVLLYELLTGTTPFDPRQLGEAGLAEIQRVIREEEPPKPSTRISTLGEEGLTAVARHRQINPRALARLLHGDLDWIVMRALEKDRARRYGTASDLARDIDRHLKSEPVEAGPPGGWYRFRKFSRRHRTALLTSFLVTAALLAGLSLAVWGFLAARDEAARSKAAGFMAASAALSEAEQRATAEAALAGEWSQRRLAEEKAAESRREAAKAKRVLQLLDEMFRSADPRGGKGASYPLRRLLDDFSRDLHTKLEKEPTVEAVLRRTIGEAYMNLGEHEEAEPHLLLAVDLCGEHLGDGHPDTSKALFRLGSLRLRQGRKDEAEKHLREAYDMARQRLQAEPAGDAEVRRERVEWMVDLGGALNDLGRAGEAVVLLEAAVQGARGLESGAGELLRRALKNLGLVLKMLGRLGEAQAVFREAMELARAALGENALETLTSTVSLADTLQEQGQIAEAEPLLNGAITGLREIAGDESQNTLEARRSLAGLHWSAGRFDKAEKLYLRLLETWKRTAGEDDLVTLTVMNDLATLYTVLNRHDEAEPLARKAFESRSRLLGEDHRDTTDSMLVLANVHVVRKRLAEAETLFVKVLQFRRLHMGKESPYTRACAQNLAILHLRQKKYAEAEEILLTCLEGYRRDLGEEHLDALTTELTLARLRYLQGRYAESETAHLELLEKLRRVLGEGNALTLTAISNLADVFLAQGRPTEAEPLLVNALEAARKRHGKDDPRTLGWLERLGNVYGELKRPNDAAALFEELLEELLRSKGEVDPVTINTANNLCKHYTDSGREDEAVAVLEKVLRSIEGHAGDEHPEAMMLRHNLGLLYQERGRHADAARLLRPVVDRWCEEQGEEDPRTLRAAGCLAAALLDQGSFEEALALSRRILPMVRSAFAAEPHVVAFVLALHAQAILGLGRPAEAESVAREALEITEKALPAGDWRTANRQSLLGECLAARGAFEDAEQLLLSGQRGVAGSEEPSGESKQKAIRRLVRLYEQWGKPEKAAEWRQSLGDSGQ